MRRSQIREAVYPVESSGEFIGCDFTSTYLVGMNESGNKKGNFSYLANTKGVQKISY